MNRTEITKIKENFKSLSALLTPQEVFITAERGTLPANINDELFNFHPAWYRMINANYSALKNPYFEETLEIARSYEKKDDQFPPDIRRLVLLNSLLNQYEPDLVLEWGCGTSTSIIRSFSNKKGCTAYSVDSSKKWIQATRSKLSEEGRYHQLLTYADFKNLQRAEEKPRKKIFAYLDAPMSETPETYKHTEIEKLDHYGLRSLSEALAAYNTDENDLLILIDSRIKSETFFPSLARILRTNLHYYGNGICGQTKALLEQGLAGNAVDHQGLNKLFSSEQAIVAKKNYAHISQMSAMCSASIIYKPPK